MDNVTGFPRWTQKKWLDRQLERQSHWDHEDYLFAYSERSDPSDYHRFQMVVKRHGGIFEASQSYGGSQFGPDSYESKLQPAELRSLEDFLTRLPPSDANGDAVHFIISFMQDGIWVTKTYGSLPPDDPLQPLLERMISQSQAYWAPGTGHEPEFLAPKP